MSTVLEKPHGAMTSTRTVKKTALRVSWGLVNMAQPFPPAEETWNVPAGR